MKPVPVTFAGCFGWLHPAPGRRGVVLCNAWGQEALCAHRSWRLLAMDLAAAGLPTLRFDYPGTGDSLDDPETPAGSGPGSTASRRRPPGSRRPWASRR
jgi:hypothetical protein